MVLCLCSLDYRIDFVLGIVDRYGFRGSSVVAVVEEPLVPGGDYIIMSLKRDLLVHGCRDVEIVRLERRDFFHDLARVYDIVSKKDFDKLVVCLSSKSIIVNFITFLTGMLTGKVSKTYIAEDSGFSIIDSSIMLFLLGLKDLSPRLYSLLKIIASNKGFTVNELARITGLSPTTIARRCNRLKNMGLVKISKYNRIYPTPAGLVIAKKLLDK